MFSVTILADPATGHWSLTVGALGAAPSADAVAHLLGVAHRGFIAQMRPTLPDGWEPTADGVDLLSEGGVISYQRTYRNGDRIVTAPCSIDGSPTHETVSALGA